MRSGGATRASRRPPPRAPTGFVPTASRIGPPGAVAALLVWAAAAGCTGAGASAPAAGVAEPPGGGPEAKASPARPDAVWVPDSVTVGGRYTTFGERPGVRRDLLLAPDGSARLRERDAASPRDAPLREGTWERLEDEVRVTWDDADDAEGLRLQVQGDVLYPMDPMYLRVDQPPFVRWSPAAREGLAGTWRVGRLTTPVERVAVPEPVRLTFGTRGRYRLVLPCLTGEGAWVAGRSVVALSRPALTATCPAEAGDPDLRRLAEHLSRVRIWWRDGARLRLELPADGGVFLLRRDQSASAASQAP